MDFKRFSIVTIGIVAAGMAGFVGLNYMVNCYGLFGDAHGKAYTAPDGKAERLAKYLFSWNYIPANFDGLLIGSSISDNWDTSVLPSGRIYNASITGGNISEQALIANNVFQRRSLKTVLVVVYPYLTETYGPKSEYMTPHEYWAALGSVQLLKVYAAKWRCRGCGQGSITSFGQYRLEAPRVAAASEPAVAEFSVNEQALAEYRDLLGNARRNGAKVVGIIPLVTKLSRDAEGSAYDRYNSRIGALFLPRGEDHRSE